MEVATLPIDQIKVTGHNFREVFEVNELADSLKHDGQLQPIVVTHDKRLISGERRLRAAQLAGLKLVDCKYQDVRDDDHLRALGVIENLQREDYTPSESARAIAWYKTYCQRNGHVTTRHDGGRGRKKNPMDRTFAEKVSEETGIGESTVARKARIGEKMSDSVAAALDDGDINEKQAEQLVRVNKELQDEIVDDVKGKDIHETKAIVEDKIKNAPPQVKIDGVPVETFAQRLFKDMERLEDKIQIAFERKIWCENGSETSRFVHFFRQHLDFCVYLEKALDRDPTQKTVGL
ncbi:MAG: ParB/RepB/Spo0J family partition protein [Bdellovibrionota bacterium]